MIARELLDTATIPGGDELRLFRRALKGADEYSIMLGRIELMNSRLSGSEEALATLTCEHLAVKNPRILIGGYGMGFTLRAALSVLPPQANVEVAELIPAIVTWAREPMAALSQKCLDDSRVTITIGDVCDIIKKADREYDAILLDVDNGPDGLTHEANDRLYSMAGLAAAKTALRANGILAVWSSEGDSRFTARLHKSGFAVDVKTVAARSNGKGAKHTIWLATKR
ncbi:MAG: spermidine synthase [Sphingomonadales bacterium]|nr:spermidine synthase [Sphingomonadales bacterium]PIX63789.1 MAG: spermidine synthase [Sphingomonadales bacterium CG_4_10_14_3_um_filter_58_15]NCO49140.1 spermidine synthase [Sphingomonadales bacterium]NCP00056.1 spermidine synthase [Sphingomonadales bacterium]NCP27331.1 spermidine synthase [Sphingomonadales bacterium]